MKTVSLSAFADELNALIPHLMKEFAARQSNELYKGRISLPQFILLAYLSKDTPRKMKDVARALGVTTAAATGAVDRLVKTGYAARVFDDRDRRIVRVKLTSKGERVFKKINLERRRVIVDIFSRISPSERKNYLTTLRHIAEILRWQRRP